MDWNHGADWTERMGRRTDPGTHWEWGLHVVASVVGYIHHGDDRVTGNDVLHYEHGHNGHHTPRVHVGYYRRGALVVPE